LFELHRFPDESDATPTVVTLPSGIKLLTSPQAMVFCRYRPDSGKEIR